jgi:hypothetical protein
MVTNTMRNLSNHIARNGLKTDRIAHSLINYPHIIPKYLDLILDPFPAPLTPT